MNNSKIKEVDLPLNIVNSDDKYNVSDYLQDEIKQDTHTKSDITKTQNINSYINMVDIINNKTILKTIRTFNPKSLYKKTYIQLDTRNAAYFDGNKTCWYLTRSPHIQQGFININCNLHEIVQIRIKNCFIYTNYMYVETWSNKAILSSRRLSFYIEELGQQSFTLNSGVKFHNVGITTAITSEISTNARLLQPDQIHYITLEEQFNNGSYQFNTPIKIFDKITLMVSDLKKYIPLYSRTIEIVNNVYFNAFLLPPYQLLGYVNDNRFPLSVQNYIKNVTLPDITTADPVTDAAWIAAMRAGSWYAYYSYQIMTIYTTLTSAPTAAIQPYTIRFPVDLKLIAEYEIIYIDASI